MATLVSEVSAQTAPAKGALDMRGPKTLVLGTDESATISIREGDKPMKMFANVGSLSKPISKNGRLTMTYTLPTTRFPQVALIVAASEDLRVVEFLSIRLQGQPTIRVNSERRAQVRVVVEGKEFGPVTLDRQGKGTIQILVPPGVDTATVVTTDRSGNSKQEERKLGVPPFQQMLAICPQGGDELVLVATDSLGSPHRSAKIEFTTSIGTLAPAEERAPGIYAARFRAGDGVAFQDTVRLTASLTGAADASTVSCEAKMPREAPSGVTVSLDSSTFVAGSGTEVLVTLDLAYPGKRLPRRVVPKVTADVGNISDPKPITQTQYQARWRLPNGFDSKSHAALRAAIEGTSISDKATLALEAGKLARLEMTSDRGRLRADQKDSARISVEAYDDYDNLAKAGDLSLTAEAGEVSVFSTDGTGAYARYTSPRRHTLGKDTITVRTKSGQESSITILLDPAPRRFLASTRLGYVTNFGNVSTVAFAADASMRLSLGHHDFAVGVETGYYSDSGAYAAESNPNERVDLGVKVVPLLGRVVYEFNRLPVRFYGGGGVGVLFAAATIGAEGSDMRTQRQPSPVFSGLLGARKRLGPGLFVLEAAYWHSQFDEAGLSGNIGGLRLSGGYGLEL